MLSVLVLGTLGVLTALVAAINTIQVFLGHQLIKPSASKRPAPQLRAESAAAAVTMYGASAAAFGILADGIWPLVGGLVMVSGWFALTRVRRRFQVHPQS